MSEATAPRPAFLDLSDVKNLEVRTRSIRVIVKGFADRNLEVQLSSDSAVCELIDAVKRQLLSASKSKPDETGQHKSAHVRRPSALKSAESLYEFYDYTLFPYMDSGLSNCVSWLCPECGCKIPIDEEMCSNTDCEASPTEYQHFVLSICRALKSHAVAKRKIGLGDSENALRIYRRISANFTEDLFWYPGLCKGRLPFLLIFAGRPLTKASAPLTYYGVDDGSVIRLAVVSARKQVDTIVIEPNAEWSKILSSVRISAGVPVEDPNDIDFAHMLSKLDLRLSDARDMLTLSRQVSAGSPRYEMQCQHVISGGSLLALYMDKVNGASLATHVKCPESGCQNLWPYPILRRISGLSAGTAEKLELKLSDNYLHDSLTVLDCPKCNSVIIRGDDSSLRCVCPACTLTGHPFSFCWKCRSELPSNSKGDFCDNPNCSLSEKKFRDEVLVILATCAKKTVGEVDGVPEYRCCPDCGQLIHHIDACKHIRCSRRRCGTDFCFVCLKRMLNDGWQCGGYTDCCPIAPIQTEDSLPRS